jgi:hypothetical protein
VGGIATPLTRVIATIWVNQQTTTEVRATVLSMLAQAEYLGEIFCGGAVAVIAAVAGLPAALVACGLMYVLTVGVVRADKRTSSSLRDVSPVGFDKSRPGC